MSKLDVPGAKLYHEVYGDGPMLLCISGADGSCEIWRDFAEELKDRFKVILWDRRGFSRSILTDNQDYAVRLERDVEDAVALITNFSPNEPVTVIGNSSGAIVSLKLLSLHPKKIRTLFCYEPPAARFCNDFDTLWATHRDVYDTYRAYGPHAALEKFAGLTHTDQRMVRALMDFERPFLFSNLQYWFEHEFMVYPQARFDIGTDLAPVKTKLVLVNGELSPRDAYQFRANEALAQMLGIEVTIFPGEHVGHMSHAKEFAATLSATLRARADFYREIWKENDNPVA